MDERVEQRCVVHSMYADQQCSERARYTLLLTHDTRPRYLCGLHLAYQLREWPDSIVWSRELT